MFSRRWLHGRVQHLCYQPKLYPSAACSQVDTCNSTKGHFESLFHENPMKMPWKPMNAFLMAMKTEISGFMAFIYTMKFPWNLEGWFSCAMKSLQKHWKWFSWVIKFLSISDWQNSWSIKMQCQPNMNFMGHENSNWPWNSHQSISGSFLQYRFIKRKKS